MKIALQRIWLWAGLLALVAGCGTGEYQERFDKTLDTIRKKAAFDPVDLNIPLGGSGLKIGRPKLFTTPLTVESGTADRPVSDKRVVIPFLPQLEKVPESRTTYEGLVLDKEGGKTPYYLYVATVPLPLGNKLMTTVEPKPDVRAVAKSDQKPEIKPATRMDETGLVFTSVKQALPDGSAKWEDIDVATPTGQRIAWQRVRATGKLETFYDPGGDFSLTKYLPIPTTVEVYARVEGERLVLILWRVPTALEAQPLLEVNKQQMTIDAFKPLVAGSLTPDTY